MKSINDIFVIDKRREEGAWVKIVGGDLAGLPVKVRSASSEAVSKLSAAIWGAASAEERKTPEFQMAMEKRVLLEAVLIDWRLAEPYTLELAKAAIEKASFREALTMASNIVGREGVDALEADAGN